MPFERPAALNRESVQMILDPFVGFVVGGPRRSVAGLPAGLSAFAAYLGTVYRSLSPSRAGGLRNILCPRPDAWVLISKVYATRLIPNLRH